MPARTKNKYGIDSSTHNTTASVVPSSSTLQLLPLFIPMKQAQRPSTMSRRRWRPSQGPMAPLSEVPRSTSCRRCYSYPLRGADIVVQRASGRSLLQPRAARRSSIQSRPVRCTPLQSPMSRHSGSRTSRTSAIHVSQKRKAQWKGAESKQRTNDTRFQCYRRYP